MTDERTFLEFAAESLGVASDDLSLETTYGSIPEWDSMAQLRLVMDVAVRYGVEIPFAEVTNVTSLWEFFRRINGLSPKKVVAVDLDNTLWDGVVGEDGPDGIRPNAAILSTLKDLKDRGVLLVVLSKNNDEDAFAGLERMVALTKDDFVSWRIDWNEKADNLRSVAQELNLGTDAFVFVDDNPAERLKMKTLLPEVTVAAFPPNLAAYFPERELTEEDRRKTEEYKAEAKRKCLLKEHGLLPLSTANCQLPTSPCPLDVWKMLGCWIDVHVMTEGEVLRVSQLSQKANQFNVCTNRRTEEEVRRLAQEGLLFTCHAGDSFGDQGLVAFVILGGDAAGGMSVLDWVMSCRVAGRGIEERFMAEVEKALRVHKVNALAVVWRASGKNAPVRELFDRLGFDPVSVSETERTYRKRL